MPDPQYSAAFNLAIAFILPHEEQFARGHWGDENFVVSENVPGDSGGLTKYGIDQRSHPGVDIESLTRPVAIAIYHDEWKWRNCDSLPEKLAVALFDVWVNGGFAIRWLQIALNRSQLSTLNSQPLIVDGDLGPKTIAAAQACDQAAILRYFINERDSRFVLLAAAHPGDRKFLAGWKQRDNDLYSYLAAA